MSPRIPCLVALAALAAGCGSTAGKAPLGFVEPSSVTVFRGFTPKVADATPHPYVAVANSGRDELLLVDAVDDQPVLAPVLVKPLSVPVPDPRPALVLSAPLNDDGADLLVTLSSGSSVIQLVRTWAADNRVVPQGEVDLAATSTGASVITAIAMPVVAADGTPVGGHARVVASLGGSQIAVVEYARQDDGSIAPVAATVQTLPFEAISLAVNPADLRHVYAATLDPIPGPSGAVEGVAELAATDAPGAWTWRGLDARAPTRLVAAFRLQERLPDSAADGSQAFEPTQVDRVYAFLDTQRCGPTQRMQCGIAVLDPVAGTLIPDPAGLMPYLAPIAVPSVPLALVISGPPVNEPSTSPDDAGFKAPFMKIAPGSGVRATTAVMALPAGDGRVYFVDLGRWAIPNDTSLLRLAGTRTAVADVAVSQVGQQRLGIWKVTTDPPELTFTTDAARPAIRVTPGFTDTEAWTATWEGVLPGLSFRRGQTGDVGDGRVWVALQVPAADGSGGTTPTQVARLYDPVLGVHVDDFVDIDTSGLAGCPGVVEARVAEFVAPDAARPGGAVILGPAPCTVGSDGTTTDCTIQTELAACTPALRAGTQNRGVTLRAHDLLVVGSTAGYAGRATVSATADQAKAAAPYALEYPAGTDEDALAAACPLVPWPWSDPFPGTAGAVPDCRDATCRDACERLLLVRKARRFYHVSDACKDPASDADCYAAWPSTLYPFPRANGPVVSFVIGLSQDPATPNAPISRDLAVSVGTRSGIVYSSRSAPPTTGSNPTLPLGGATFDRSAIPGRERDGYRFYVPYIDGHVLDFSPSLSPAEAVVIR